MEGANIVTQFIDYTNQIDVASFVISIMLIAVAIKFLGKGLRRIGKGTIVLGLYLFTRGIITTGMVMEWWNQVPGQVQAFFMINP